MENIPIYSEDLIKLLSINYPHKCPTLNETEREIFMYSGKRELIDGLMNYLNIEILYNQTKLDKINKGK